VKKIVCNNIILYAYSLTRARSRAIHNVYNRIYRMQTQLAPRQSESKLGTNNQRHGTAMITRTRATSMSAELNDERRFQCLVEDHFPMVQSTVNRMRQKLPNTIETDELHSIGLTGLVAAAQRYQPSLQGSFAAYAATRIRGAILDELRRQDY